MCSIRYSLIKKVLFAVCKVLADLVVLVDNSGSITEKGDDNYVKLKSFLANFVNTIDVGIDKTRIGVLRFSNTANVEFYLNSYFKSEEINDAIRRMGYEGSYTNIADGLRTARTNMFIKDKGDRPEIKNVLLLITDGESNREENLTKTEAQEARDAGITVFVVGVTSDININELHDIASPPVNEHYFNASDIDALEKIFQALLKQVCTKPSYSIQKSKYINDLVISMSFLSLFCTTACLYLLIVTIDLDFPGSVDCEMNEDECSIRYEDGGW